MKVRNSKVPILIMLFILGAALIPEIRAQQGKEQSEIIPDEVKSVLMQGMESREVRTDIPFSITDYYYLPASENLYFILLFKVKNADLGYAPVTPDQKKEQQEQQAFVEKSPERLQNRFDVFMIFKQLEGDYEKELFIPAGFQINQDLYDPEKEEMYSTGYILPPGKYILSMALTQNNYQKIGTQYYEFEIEDPAAFGDKLGVAPPFFIKETQKMEAPEKKTYIHRGFFTYSILKIMPVPNNTFSSGDVTEIFFYIMGGSPDPQTQKYDYTVNYQVLKEGQKEPLIRFAEGTYNSPIVIQPLKFERTVLIQKKKGDEIIEERTEKRDLDVGPYLLRIEIKDNTSGKTTTKDVPIMIK
jgi:hypothetical protein